MFLSDQCCRHLNTRVARCAAAPELDQKPSEAIASGGPRYQEQGRYQGLLALLGTRRSYQGLLASLRTERSDATRLEVSQVVSSCVSFEEVDLHGFRVNCVPWRKISRGRRKEDNSFFSLDIFLMCLNVILSVFFVIFFRLYCHPFIVLLEEDTKGRTAKNNHETHSRKQHTSTQLYRV